MVDEQAPVEETRPAEMTQPGNDQDSQYQEEGNADDPQNESDAAERSQLNASAQEFWWLPGMSEVSSCGSSSDLVC